MTRHVITISGKDSLATAIVCKDRWPDRGFEYLFNDTGAELPEVYLWLDAIEASLGISIQRIGKKLTDVIYEQNAVPSPKCRFCTRISKIYPMEDFLGGSDSNVVVYFGLRADEPDRGGYSGKLSAEYPLRDLGLGLLDVYSLIEQRGLGLPDFTWGRLVDCLDSRIQLRGGFYIKSVEDLPPWVRAELLHWRSRPNCYYCFYQREYEWLGLWEHWPDLFGEAKQIEEDIGFNWIAQDFPLDRVVEERDRIFESRAKRVLRALVRREWEDPRFNRLSDMAPSCGLFCGK